jgi:hypothetical protein
MKTSTPRSLVSAFFVAVGAVALMPLSGFAQQSLSAKDKDRLERLERLADAIEKVKVDRRQSTGDREVEGRRLSNNSELHMRFMAAAGTLAANGKDGLCAFPLQVSGYSSAINSAKGVSDRKSGADLQRATIVLQGLIGQPRPRARVELAPLNHGSAFPADQIARDRIHDLIRLFFPEAEIDGVQRFFEKEFEVRNETDEQLRVWAYGRTWDKSPSQTKGAAAGVASQEAGEDSGGFTWIWKPGTPSQVKPFEITVPAGKSRKFTDAEGGTQALAANRVLVWAESESGERWLDHERQSLWLVEPDPQDNGERTYHAKQVETYVYSIKPKPGPRVFTERTLELKNATSEQLTVHLRYRTNSAGAIAWQAADVTIAPEQSLRPRGPDGTQIRASQVLFAADGRHRRYTKHEREPLLLVDEKEGVRAYKADKIGSYLYTFETGAAGKAGEARITGARVPVSANGRTLAYVNRGEQYRVVDSDDEDIKIAVTVRGREYTGWVSRRNAEMGPPPAPAAPVAVRQTLRITADRAAVKVGSTVIGHVDRNKTYQVLEKKDGQARIEVNVEGTPRHVWLNLRDAKMVDSAEADGE